MTESSKRRRVNSSPVGNSRSESALTCVQVVCQNGPDILSLPHIVATLDEFLDNSGNWTLPKACASASPYLVERLLLRYAAETSSRCWYRPNYRQWQFETSLKKAATVESLKIVQLLERNFRDCFVSKDFLENAIRRGLSDIVMWLLECGCNVHWDAGTVRVAIRSGNFKLAKWLKGKIKTTIEYEMTEWAMAAASQARGHVAVLTWLIRNHPTLCNGDAHFNAAKRGHLEITRLLLSSGIGYVYSGGWRPVEAAAANGHLEIVKCLVEEGFPATNALFVAAKNGFVDIVKWLHEKFSHYSCAGTMDTAAANGHLDIVKWLHDNCNQDCTVDAMDNAAGNGFFHVVQWLHENRTEGCTTFAMNEAASIGKLEIVKWLHFNRPEGCTTKAMDSAAGNGHLDVVKWLHENRSEGCTTDAMDNAAKNNHLEVLQWLDQNRVEGFTFLARDNAASQGNWDAYEWLIHRRPELCRTPMANTHDKVFYAARYGRFDIVWFLYKNYCSNNTLRGALRNTINSLASNLTFKFADWAYTHHRDEFELNIAEHLFAD
eukprot:jgi/Phyca11/106581/e_gw1.12.162.1